MALDRAAITGLILAGGRGARMGHVDKGLQLLRGRPMVAHALERLAPQVGRMAINANQNQRAYAAFGVPVWADDLTGFEGPLAGLETGLRRCPTPLMATVPCDSPCLPLDLVARLLAALQDHDADLALAETLEDNPGARVQPHPVFTLVKRAALAQLSAYLAGGGRRMDGWHASIKTVRVRFDDASAFRNINTLRELQQLEQDEQK